MERDTSPLTLALFDLLELNETLMLIMAMKNKSLCFFFGVEEEDYSRAYTLTMSWPYLWPSQRPFFLLLSFLNLSTKKKKKDPPYFIWEGNKKKKGVSYNHFCRRFLLWYICAHVSFSFTTGKNLRVLNYLAISDCFFLLLFGLAVWLLVTTFERFLMGPAGSVSPISQ